MMSPDSIKYAAKPHPGLRVTKPFVVRFQKAGESFCAYAPEVEEYGIGDSRSDALQDLGRTLAELFFSLEKDSSRLSADLLFTLDRLRAHLAPVVATC